MNISEGGLPVDKNHKPKLQLSKDRTVISRWLFYIAVYIIIFALVSPISPLSDDWYYLTAPNPDFTMSDLLPGSSFWRPFDALFGGLMGFMPALFPAINRAAVILAHVLNAVFLDCILKKMEIRHRRFAVCYFLFSSATWAVTVSPDALNQAYSVLFGLMAIYIHLKKGGYFYLFLCTVALLWKESGISWFFVIPIMDAVMGGKTWIGFTKNPKLVKRCILETLLSVGAVCAYFAVRFLLYGSITLGGDSGRYHVSLLSLSTIKNAVMLFASAGSGVDSIALFSNTPSMPLAAITVMLSLVFLVMWICCAIQLLRQKKELFALTGIVLCVLGLAAPLCIIGSAGEMHAYPVLCAITFLYSFCFDRAQISPKKMAVATVCIFLAFTISSTHKLISIYDYSERTQVLTQNLKNCYTEQSGAVLFVEIDGWEGYSVFNQSALTGTSDGFSLRPYYSWQELKHSQYSAKSREDALAYIQQHRDAYTSIFLIQGETVQKMK